ncbi:relaxase MobL [Virgibacillus dokdonensis]|uniref:Relaxase MobL n=2 Tax=Virgibacillus dokdonensis TaxID=302167 RepID=A0ABU7VJA7_9BACI
MWQDVLSFDNAFLEEQGLYNSKTKQLDERRMKNIVRGAVKGNAPG